MNLKLISRFQFMLLLFLFGSACSAIPDRDRNSVIFDYYLHKAFGDSIRTEKACYLLVPERGCKGCRITELELLTAELKKIKNKSAIQFIFSPNTCEADFLKGKVSSRTDSSGLINEINLPLSNITIIKTENRRISLLKEIYSDRMDSIGYYLR